MKKNGILNSDISRVLSYMGHTDTITVADCGLPIPEETERIDLSLKFGVPRFLDVLSVLLEDMKAEKIYLAEEIKEKNPEVLEGIEKLLPGIPAVFVPHDELKAMTHETKAVIRTGETTPYANIIIQSGCIFS